MRGTSSVLRAVHLYMHVPTCTGAEAELSRIFPTPCSGPQYGVRLLIARYLPTPCRERNIRGTYRGATIPTPPVKQARHLPALTSTRTVRWTTGLNSQAKPTSQKGRNIMW